MRLEGSSGFGVGAMANSVRLRWRLKMEIKEGGEGPWTKAQTRGIGYRDDGLSVSRPAAGTKERGVQKYDAREKRRWQIAKRLKPVQPSRWCNARSSSVA